VAEAPSASLAAFVALLACPACRSELQDLALRSDCLLCRQCGTRFPLFRNGATTIPWLFRDPDGAHAEWRARFNGYLHASTAEQNRLKASLSDPNCGPAASARIATVKEAKETQRRQIFDLLAPLALDAPRTSAALDRAGLLHGKLPRQQSLTSYHDNVFRDWAWENGENERLLECLASVLRPVAAYSAGKVLALGAGACRLPYDFHSRYQPELTIALDLNPLLLLLAGRVLQGQTVPFYEFPVAPLDKGSFAVLRACVAPRPLTSAELAGFALVLGDALYPPFKQAAFDTVLTPWYIDIVPQDLADCVRNVNRLLKPGGVWLNTGSLAFFHRNEGWCYSDEEALDLLRGNGFEVLAAERATVPYLHSPASAHGRVEQVWSFAARKVAQAQVSRPTAYLPPWIRDPDRPVPDLDEFVVASASHLLKAQTLAAIDGRRTLEEIAALVAKRYGIQRSEARGAVERILLEIYEAATLGKTDDVSPLE
jgi:SAM-dependent methyltransferase